MYALNAGNGHKIWSHALNDNAFTPIVANGAVLVGASDGSVYALNQNNGSQIWKTSTGGLTRPWFSATQGVLYVGSSDGNLYAFNVSNGNQLWKFSASGGFNSPSVGQ